MTDDFQRLWKCFKWNVKMFCVITSTWPIHTDTVTVYHTASIVALVAEIWSDIGWFLWGKWSPTNLSKESLRAHIHHICCNMLILEKPQASETFFSLCVYIWIEFWNLAGAVYMNSKTIMILGGCEENRSDKKGTWDWFLGLQLPQSCHQMWPWIVGPNSIHSQAPEICL